ncbi:DUF4169 family protein [Roseomonas rosulenta]|uniref:DUF4169 family protein n=1 Tax=Roseomonas rosulenta TaxID=2748667 RepID=UPI0018E00FD1|nr:DUF4169 family protein [Roseomonas rosulenta]
MAEIVNLNKARKARARDDKAAEAVANRAKHGRSKAQKQNDARAEDRRRALLDGAKREE